MIDTLQRIIFFAICPQTVPLEEFNAPMHLQMHGMSSTVLGGIKAEFEQEAAESNGQIRKPFIIIDFIDKTLE